MVIIGDNEEYYDSPPQPATRDVPPIPERPCRKTSSATRRLQFENNETQGSEEEGPAASDPTGRRKRRRGTMRTLVRTPQGKHVLSSDVRLHLERMKALKKAESMGGNAGKKSEEHNLEALDRERRILEAELRQRQEIARIRSELGSTLPLEHPRSTKLTMKIGRTSLHLEVATPQARIVPFARKGWTSLTKNTRR